MDYKKMARELERSEKRFMDISLTTGDMIFDMDQDYTFQFVAGRVFDVTGLPDEAILGRKFPDFLDTSEWERIRPQLEEAAGSKNIVDLVFTAQNSGVHHCIAKPVFNENNQSFKGFRGTWRDITIRKNLEKALDKKMLLLQSSIDAIADSGVVITDRQNRILHWNTAFEEFFHRPGKARKKTDAENLLLSREDKEKCFAEFRKEMDEFLISPRERVDHLTLKNGRKIRRRAIPVYRNGIIVGRVFFLRDVSYIPDAEAI
jgi:PAS domain S-box-containing protein